MRSAVRKMFKADRHSLVISRKDGLSGRPTYVYFVVAFSNGFARVFRFRRTTACMRIGYD
jgi:hypothetical protein